ncbi:hypothetical protein GALL_496890 [mine drainage metagenome]|uniref:Uncharacterized protein n=1 Tax=mine drainage metagenome TaxID=410659 RepID=A0A1J5PM99_9ZZZZ
MPYRVANQRQHADAEGQIGLRGLEQTGAANFGNAVRAMGEPDGVDHDQRDDLLKRDRHHRKVMPAEPKRRHAEQRAGQQRDHASAGKAQPVTEMVVRRAKPDGVGAQTEKCRLREIDLPAKAEHDRKPEHRDRKGGRLHQDVVNIAVELHRGGERHDDGRAREIRQVTQQHRFCARRRHSHRHVFARGAHAFSATRSPKMPWGRNTRNATSTRKAKPSL